MKVSKISMGIQGRGSFAGIPAVFVYLQGCPHKCMFCNAKETWEGGVELTPREIVERVQICSAKYPYVKHVVITGGEPFYGRNGRMLCILVGALQHAGYRIQIETVGSHGLSLPTMEDVLFIISPKGAPELMPLNSFFLEELEHGCQIDFVFIVDCENKAEAMIENYLRAVCVLADSMEIASSWNINDMGSFCDIYVHPLDYHPLDCCVGKLQHRADLLAAQVAMRHGWFLGVNYQDTGYGGNAIANVN